MGANMYAGEAEIYTRDGCSLVSNWCHRFDKRDFSNVDWTDLMGVYDFPNEIVQAANAAVPLTFSEALAGGWIHEPGRYRNRDTTPEAFDEVRRFLTAAAECGEGIRGGY